MNTDTGGLWQRNMSEVDEFVQKLRVIGPVAYISDSEASDLYNMAKKCDKGTIVNIGVGSGGSVCCLAAGSVAGHGVPVYAVDPFHGGVDVPAGGYAGAGKHVQVFLDSIAKWEFPPNLVRTIPNFSELAIKEYDGGPIELLFIDGDHHQPYVQMDRELWGPLILSGGIIAMHDSSYTDVRPVCNMISASEDYDMVRRGDNGTEPNSAGFFYARKK